MIYFVPGYIALSWFIAIAGLKFGEAEKLILSCVISFVAVSLVRIIADFNIYVELLISIGICLVGAGLVAKVYQSKWFRNLCTYALGFSFCQSPWEDTLDYHYGTNIKVKMKGSDMFVEGKLYSIGDITANPWLAISNYSILDGPDDDNPYAPGMGACFMVNTNDIEYAEVYPDKAEE